MTGLAEYTHRVAGFWAGYGDTAVLGAGGLLGLLIASIGLFRFARSTQKDRWIDRLAAVLVLAWTSEGMWEVATQTLQLAVPFAVVTFFVAEAMMLSSAMRAAAYRAAKGVPGPSGTFVWVLAVAFGGVVALSANSPAEFVLRIVLPLSAVALWWLGLTAERAEDSDVMKAERANRAAAREATWAVTPRTLLVRSGLMKPGKTTTTEAQRELQINRMVTARTAIIGEGRGANRARTRLRRLARTATAEMIVEVQQRVQRAHRVEASTGPRDRNGDELTPATTGATAVDAQVQRTRSTLLAIDPQLAEVVRNRRPAGPHAAEDRNGEKPQPSAAATGTGGDRSDAALLAIVAPLVAHSLAATGITPSQRSVRAAIEDKVRPAPGFKRVAELIERATRQLAESTTTIRDDESEHQHNQANGHRYDLAETTP